eukprot:11164163-Lingulodinium_polyedra.AAC.1
MRAQVTQDLAAPTIEVQQGRVCGGRPADCGNSLDHQRAGAGPRIHGYSAQGAQGLRSGYANAWRTPR